jgi:hypothetical protein
MAAKEAAGIVQQILDHKETDYLVWCPDGRLKIVMWMLLNETGQQVRSYRHKRLSQELLTQLKAVGWEKVSPATFRKRQPADALPAGM